MSDESRHAYPDGAEPYLTVVTAEGWGDYRYSHQCACGWQSGEVAVKAELDPLVTAHLEECEDWPGLLHRGEPFTLVDGHGVRT